VSVMAVGIVNAPAQGGPSNPLWPTTIFQAPTMPPPLRSEAIPKAPSADFVWVRGSWAYDGAKWVWVPGAWLLPPKPGAVWVSGHWNPQDQGSSWVDGYWR